MLARPSWVGMFGSVLICCLYAVSSPAGVQVLQIDDLASAPASGLSRNDVFLHGEVCVRVDGQQRSYRLRLEGDQGLGHEHYLPAAQAIARGPAPLSHHST